MNKTKREGDGVQYIYIIYEAFNFMAIWLQLLQFVTDFQPVFIIVKKSTIQREDFFPQKIT